MQYVIMYGVMLILSIPCLFVLLRLARGYEDLNNPLVTGISSARQIVLLITFMYPIMFFNVIYSCICLILMGPNRSPLSVYPVYLVYPDSLR
jgi:hypothetical protein